MNFKACLLLIAVGLSAEGAWGNARTLTQDLQGVSPFNLNAYLGTWHEQATIEMRFQRGCECTTAEYSMSKSFDGIDVVNRCRKGGPGSSESVAKGRARFSSENKNQANLEVNFFLWFWGDYRVVHWSTEGQWVIVSNREGKSFWLLSRSRVLNEQEVEKAFARAKELGIPIEKSKRTNQNNCS